MTLTQLAILAPCTIAFAAGLIFSMCEWQDRRKRQPMPPLYGDVPGLPGDGHGTLTPLQQRHLERIEGLYDLAAPEPVYKRQRDEEQR